MFSHVPSAPSVSSNMEVSALGGVGGVVQISVALVSPGRLLEMQMLRPFPRPTESETL